MIQPSAAKSTLAHELTLPILGVPVCLRTNSPALIDAFESSLGGWRVMERHPHLLSHERVRGTLALGGGDEGDGRPVPIAYDVRERGRLVISSPGSIVRGDASRRAFDGRVSAALLQDAERFRYKVLEAVVLSVVTHLDRQPVHAAAIVRGGAALLLAGPSGTGKSTLSYAAARSGLRVLSEDTVFAQLEGGLRLWAMPGFVNVPPDGGRHFAELVDAPRQMLPTGKEKIRVSLSALEAAAPQPFIDRAGICFVERAPGARGLSVEPLNVHGIESAMLRHQEPGFDLFDGSRAALARALAAGGGWRLTLGDHPDAALPVLRDLLDQVDERLGPASSS
jgi:hypothetical protein